ncbi:hypothetical protein [Ligilactobacillus salivarius]|uniref:hypothetical protein n=1 Tax=Ligilactobacillus salivarius TaxID=1624 RepID=UPI00177B8696|nr:hypothetical protein [Ligilactobacillus salivarius]
MSKKCFIDNEKLGMMTNSFKTKDGNVLCAKHAEVLGLTPKDVSELLTTDIKDDFNDLMNAMKKFNITDINQLSKSERKSLAYLAKRNLNKLSPDTYKQVEDITTQIAGNRLMLLGLGLQGSVDSLTPSYLAAILEQNWILIRQNEQIIELLKDKE